MRWPWVSRGASELVRETMAAELGRARADLTDASARYDALLERYHALRVQGAGPESPAVVPVAARPDPVTQAVIAKSRGNAFLRAHYFGYATMQRHAGMAEDDIATRILVGEIADPENDGVPVAS